jgi:hypothetical protein
MYLKNPRIKWRCGIDVEKCFILISNCLISKKKKNRIIGNLERLSAARRYFCCDILDVPALPNFSPSAHHQK